MRPPAIERMGYYPTDEPVVEIIRTYLKPSAEKGRLFDPCAGEGKAASYLGNALNCETWGVELSPERAEKAQNAMDKVYQAPWQACVLSDESVSWLYLNPPYEFDRFDGQKRLEWDFLKTTTSKLMHVGLLTYIIPQKILGMIEVARMLAGHYEAINVYRFPDGLYEKFKQVVLMAYKRKQYQIPTDKEVLSLQNMATTELEPIETAVEPIYELLSAPIRGVNGKPIVFKRTDWEPEEVVEATVDAGVHKTNEWLDLIHPTRCLAQLSQPVMPLKKGHIAMLMASGMMGTVRLTDEAGKPILIKGRVIKVVEKTEQPDAKDTDTVVETYKDKFVTTVAVLRQDGIQVIQDVKGLSEFMKAHGEKIAAHVLETYKPLYNLDPTPREIAVLDTIGTQRKPLPGQERAGLLPAQRHAAAALARSIHKNGVANCQAEMGSGKTSIGSAVIELLDAYPALVLCPPHLVPKWIREIAEVIPGAHARELRRIGRNSDEVYDVNDVAQFLGQYQQASETAKRNGDPKPKWVAVVAHTSAKFGTGWQPAVIWRKTRDPLTGKIVDACACPGCGKVVMAEKDSFVIPVTDLSELVEKRQFCRNRVPGWEMDSDGRIILDTNGDPVWGSHACNTPLFEFSGARRHSIADYITKHQKDAFQILVADECLVRDTLIETQSGLKAIQDIQVGDEVLSFNHETDALEYKKVLRTMKNPAPEKLIEAAGIVSTAGHPIYTEEDNYVEAQKISGKTLRILRKDIYDLPKRRNNFTFLFSRLRNIKLVARDKKESRRISPQTIGSGNMSAMWQNLPGSANGSNFGKPEILLEPLLCNLPFQKYRFGESICSQNERGRKRLERDEEARCRRTYDPLKPNAQSGGNQQGKSSSQWQNISLAWWQWNDHKTTRAIMSGAWITPLRDGIRDTYRKCKALFPVLTASLQGRPGNSRGQTDDRNRWTDSQNEKMEIFGRTENRSFELFRVDGITVLECGSDGRYEQVCPDGCVYNLEVEGNNNYFANGVLVHNCHQFKSKSSDRGIAFHQLVGASKSTLTLTGTFFGGKSTSIFWLLHRLNHGVRRDFAFHDEKRWARLYGVLETTRRRRRDDDADEDGVFTGNRRYRNQAKEQPGVSPAIVSRLLDTTVFLSLKDLNLALPSYKEEVVTLEMLDDQGQQYHSMDSSLKQLAVQSSRYLSTWLQWSLARPNSAFRDEVVVVDEVDGEDGKSIRKVPLMELPAINPNGHKWLPKENWLADFCKVEKQQGRKVLIYVRQTGTRDIQDRVMMPLQASGLRVAILGSNIDPRKREDWIAKRAQTIDALICNPRLVETGLDLVQFSTVIYFEIEYSLYTLWQSVRRVWRLGQTQPVKAIFSVYSSAMEATALALMGKKMKAAQLVYGDEVGGAIVPEDEGDFLTQLARDVLEGAKLSDLQTLFADDLQLSHNPLGSLTVPSAVIVPGPKVMTWDDWVTHKIVVVRRTRRKDVVPEGQMGFGI
jgi:hypothetical protein